MTHWTSGYVDGLDYTFDYYRELAPSLLAFYALCRGQRFSADSRMSYCELGCGQGFSANLLAAANPDTDFHANDFNPSHVANARGLANEAGLTNVHFHEHAFADYIDEPGLPKSFDIIALHGVFSWISPENRQHIVDFIARKLRPGGLVYISYNVLPGWSVLMPLRRILLDRAAAAGGPLAPRITDALAFAEALRQVDAAYFTHNPAIAPRLHEMTNQSRNYLAHEFFNRDWTPFYFTDLAAELSFAKLSFVGSTDLNGHIDALTLTEAQKRLLDEEVDPLRREGLRDIIVNQQFRSDLFAKGPMPHTDRSGAGAWLESRFVLTRRKDTIALTVRGRFGDVPLAAHVYEPLLDALADGPRSLRQLLADTAVTASAPWEHVTEAITLLVGAGHLQPCLPEAGETERSKSCRKFNMAVCQRAGESGGLQFLASPVTGAGVQVDRLEQLFLLAIKEGHAGPPQWADYAWSVLVPQDGQTPETSEEAIAELRRRAQDFSTLRLPICRHLGILL